MPLSPSRWTEPVNYSIKGWIRFLDDIAGDGDVAWVPAGYRVSDIFLAVQEAAPYNAKFSRLWFQMNGFDTGIADYFTGKRFGVPEDTFGVIHSCR